MFKDAHGRDIAPGDEVLYLAGSGAIIVARASHYAIEDGRLALWVDLPSGLRPPLYDKDAPYVLSFAPSERDQAPEYYAAELRRLNEKPR